MQRRGKDSWEKGGPPKLMRGGTQTETLKKLFTVSIVRKWDYSILQRRERKTRLVQKLLAVENNSGVPGEKTIAPSFPSKWARAEAHQGDNMGKKKREG